jgi:diguanylate cyclase (GGDEF)-like protein
VANQRILIADDEPDIRVVLRTRLEQDGFTVIEARDGAEAVHLAQTESPDLIVLDVMMPEMDGVEVCNRLRASFTTRSIPVIMLTAKAGKDDRMSGLKNGANDYITKPFDLRELTQRVRNTLDWSRQQRAASPLTGLPGNHSINDEIRRRLNDSEPFALLQIDIDHFKAFNDYYGYGRGDEAIQLLARILSESVYRSGDREGFVGHIGGDDFLYTIPIAAMSRVCDEVIRVFDELIPLQYSEQDRRVGYFFGKDRRGQLHRVPLMTLSVGVVTNQRRRFTRAIEVSELATEMKTYAKTLPGSVWAVDRRREESSASPIGASAADIIRERHGIRSGGQG